jgi:hypothetical protein
MNIQHKLFALQMLCGCLESPLRCGRSPDRDMSQEVKHKPPPLLAAKILNTDGPDLFANFTQHTKVPEIPT